MDNSMEFLIPKKWRDGSAIKEKYRKTLREDARAVYVNLTYVESVERRGDFGLVVRLKDNADRADRREVKRIFRGVTDY